MPKLMRSLHLAEDDVERPSLPPLPPNASLTRRWKFRRNLALYLAHRGGMSQRVLADAFDLPRSRIATIIKQFDRLQAVSLEDSEPAVLPARTAGNRTTRVSIRPKG